MRGGGTNIYIYIGPTKPNYVRNLVFSMVDMVLKSRASEHFCATAMSEEGDPQEATNAFLKASFEDRRQANDLLDRGKLEGKKFDFP